MGDIVRFAGRKNPMERLYRFAAVYFPSINDNNSNNLNNLSIKTGEIILGVGKDSDSPYDGVLAFYNGQIVAELPQAISLPVVFLANPCAGIIENKREFHISGEDSRMIDLLKGFVELNFFYDLKKDERGVLRFSPSALFIGREEVLRGLETLFGRKSNGA